MLVTGAAVACKGVAPISAAAAQQDDDQNDPQASAVVTVVPHVVFTSLSKSKLYYVRWAQK